MKLNPNQPLAGILEPVWAIRTDHGLGIGDTEGVRQMIEWCHRHHLHVFQTLPINETGGDNSPYNAISSLAIEPSTIAISPQILPDLPAARFSALATPALLQELRRGAVDYPKVKALKLTMLRMAFEHFQKHELSRHTRRATQFHAFLTENAGWLGDYALFRLLLEAEGNNADWQQWKPEHQTPEQARAWLVGLPREERDALVHKHLFFQYVQWIAFTQWHALKEYGSEKKVYLMGDIPFGVGRCSADVWANRAIFDLDWSGGAPPEKAFKVDPFTEKWGQNWGIPTYRWDELERRNFDWWRTRIGNLCRIFHLYRIDHALGFFRIYSFPWTPERNPEFLPLSEAEATARTNGRLPGFKPFPDDTPDHRASNQEQGKNILKILAEASGDATVVAEDLGVVPDYVPVTLHELGIPGFRIPTFLREADGRFADPKKYPRLSLTQPATHDHAPLAAVWEECWKNILAGNDAEHNQSELRRIMDFAGVSGDSPPRDFSDQLHEGYLRRVMQSNSWLAVVMITDVLGIPDRFNVPGAAATSNWSSRLPLTVQQLDENPVMRAKIDRFSRLVREALRVLPTH